MWSRSAVGLLLFGLACAEISPHAASDAGAGAGGAGCGGGGAGAPGGIPPPTFYDGGSDTPPRPPPGDAGTCQHELRAIVRDFRSGEKDGQPIHPDFENKVAADPGIVATVLGGDLKPVYAGGTQATTTSKENFDQWFRDVAGVNLTFEKTIPLTADPARAGVWLYDSDAFYPLGNDEGWGNQYLDHNQDFTTEIHLGFPYNGGEVFSFRGDDDLFLFVNGHLAVDLGGVHSALTGTVDMDARAGELGLEIGKTYAMDVFHAERHCCQSTFHVETTLSCITNIIID